MERTGALRKSRLELFVALEHLGRRALGERALDHFGVKLHLLAPFRLRDFGCRGDTLGTHRLESAHVERARNIADRSRPGSLLAPDAPHDPPETAPVRALPGPVQHTDS